MIETDNQRNTAKEKLKRNKGFPYKCGGRNRVNRYNSYRIVNSAGEPVEYFRLKATAIFKLDKLNAQSKGEYRIEKLETKEKVLLLNN